MNIKNFKSGNYIQQYKYKCFLPSKINQTWTWDEPEINVMLEKATKDLGELNAFSLIVPDIDLFIHMHVLKEANTSSKIEGTNTEIDEALMNKEDIAPEKRNDWQEVTNYVNAMNFAIDKLKKLPLSNRLLKETHEILMQGVRGEHKNPGEFRKSQNWIGGSNLSDAIYIPPIHNEIPELMSDLEIFMQNENVCVPHLIKIAISHYQFETIHPFLDGNGRIGRLLIILYMISNNLLNKPSLYISDFLEKNRTSYYNALSKVRESNDLSHWIKFFLNGIIVTANKGKNTFKSILTLKNQIDNKIVALGRKAKNGKILLNKLYKKPIISSNEIADFLNIAHKTANILIKDFEKLGILKEITGYKRNRMFMFEDYLKLF